MRLRAERPRVTRLSRKVLAGGAAIGSAAILGAIFWALQNNRSHTSALSELYTTDHHNVADGLTGLPRDYAGMPRQAPPLGPALPGDLGRPILNAQNSPSAGIAAIDSEQQRLGQETEAARLSRLFASTSIRELAPSIAQAASVGTSSTTVPNQTSQPALAADDAFAQNGQDRKLAFVNASVDRRTTSPDRVAAPSSSYVVQAGNVISASLITGIRSDLPGQITAQVTENIYDSPTGRFLLIPQGTRLIGIYDSQVAFGQSRVLLVWTRLIMPNGRSIVLERQAGADTAGYAGLEDDVDNHWGALFKAALLSTLLGVGSELGSTSGTGSNSDVIQALRRGSSDSLNQTGQKVVQRNLNIQPTLTIRPGFPVRVIVNRDLVLEPYKG
ncbi:TrbI/VirB10 family protein [Bradyrhizobium manausense]|uniref:TrbI/VirB10 family protein n=1 Tax=Bradyrhizobium manausense TaxID=989370 RepID=UPI001BA6C722|nr:TrbI/VirB10 family protein [Bradyrhizobium manausense]MBR1087831.1 TrbI/VirB10 family protein [Bradyrhizobium manausense]